MTPPLKLVKLWLKPDIIQRSKRTKGKGLRMAPILSPIYKL